MRYPIIKYEHWRKKIAFVMLILFSTSTIVSTFPIFECNMICQNTSEMQSCCSEVVESTSCCSLDVRSVNPTEPFQDGETISNQSCEMELLSHNLMESTPPKSENQPDNLIEITIIGVEKVELKSSSFRSQIQHTFYNNSPIYLQIESFLI